jgi:multidrug efflux system membrane fusion protein
MPLCVAVLRAWACLARRCAYLSTNWRIKCRTDIARTGRYRAVAVFIFQTFCLGSGIGNNFVTGFFRLHRIAALFVLIAAAAWIGTGEFAAVGSHEAKAEGNEPPTAATPEPVAPLRTVAGVVPEFEDHARKIRLSGATQPDKRAVLAARADGVVQSLDLVKGATVTADVVVMTLEGPETVARAKIAEIQLAQRERDLELAERLFKGGNAPETQFTNAQSARDAADAELTQARAAVDKLTLVSPFSGLVDSVNVELAEWVRSGTPVATILSLDPILVRGEVSELDIGNVSTGDKARIRLVNGMELEGEVRFIAREASAQTRTFPVEVALPNPGNAIPAGMTAELELFAAPVRTVTVPRSIITLSDTGEVGLRVVGADNLARFIPVGIVDDSEAGLVVTGVPEDVRIIVAGQDLVRDGEEVIVADAPQVQP